jgi:hypothetical protein
LYKPDKPTVSQAAALTGLPATLRSVAAAMFAPCSNITIAAAEIAERRKTSSHSNRDPIYCAIAVARSWDRPDNAFAEAVRTSVANSDAPDFEGQRRPVRQCSCGSKTGSLGARIRRSECLLQLARGYDSIRVYVGGRLAQIRSTSREPLPRRYGG